jgi:hypothetical protein
MFRLSGQLRRILGKKALELQGNAVLGVQQAFDLEDQTRSIIGRACATVVRLISKAQLSNTDGILSLYAQPSQGPSFVDSPITAEPFSIPGTPKRSPIMNATDPPKDIPMPNFSLVNTSQAQYKGFEQYIFTLTEFPPGVIMGIGGLVSATSVKLISSDDEELRETWWNELREELKSHARALGCPMIIGYSENITIDGELAVLHCSGTAAIIDMAILCVDTLSLDESMDSLKEAPRSAHSSSFPEWSLREQVLKKRFTGKRVLGKFLSGSLG